MLLPFLYTCGSACITNHHHCCWFVAAVLTFRDRARRSTATMVKDPFTLVVALDESGNAEGDLYLDDGHSFAFTKGAYLHRK